MTKLCLRCDWTGETKERVCPSCGAGLYLPAGAPSPAPRWRLRRRRSRAEEAPADPTPSAESFDPSTPADEVDQPVTTSRRAGWVALAVVLVAVVVVAVVITRSSPPSGPVPGVEGDLVFLSPESETSSRMWIWDLATGAIDRGPVVDAPVELVETYLADPQGGWVGVTSLDGDQQVAGLLKNFAETDVPTPLLRGDLVAWSPGGDRVVAGTKPGGTCSSLRVDALRPEAGAPSRLVDGRVCGQLDAIAINGQWEHVGLADDHGGWVVEIVSQEPLRWLDGAWLVAVSDLGGVLVVPSCEAPDVPPATCGALAYARPSSDPAARPVPFGDPAQGLLSPERFLGWSRDGMTGYVVGQVGDVRGIYSVAPTRLEPGSPTLILASLASELSLTESTGADGGRWFVSRDGALAMIRESGEQVPLTLPDDVPSPEGPILWLPSVGGAD